MNDYGKLGISTFAPNLFAMFILLSILPFYEANGSLPVEGMTDLQISEIVFWAGFFAFILGSFYALSYIISFVGHYLVYFVQRYWYLRKLRKPERIYTGDPL